MLKILLLLQILLTIASWNHVSCNDSSTDEYLKLEKMFKKRYMSNLTGYQPWKEFGEAMSAVLEEVCKTCSNCASKADNNTMIIAAGEKKPQNSYGLLGHEDSIIQLDTILCSVSSFRGEGAAEENEEFHLCEGDEPKSVFQFTVKDLNIVLIRKINDVWPKPEYVLD